VKVEKTRASRRSWLAAATTPCMTLPSLTGSCPSSASSWYSNPPLVERPMMGGRLKATIVAVLICWPSANILRISA